MKKILFAALAAAIVLNACKNKADNEYTLLQDYTPYESYPEKMVGKIEKVIEKNYWAVPEGNTYVKGNPVTVKDRDTLNWTLDFEAVFDMDGDLVSCKTMDENGKILSVWKVTKENNILTKAEYFNSDTIRAYDKLRCDAGGAITGAERYRVPADTLLYSYNVIKNLAGDTVKYEAFNYKGIPLETDITVYDRDGKFLSYERFNDKNESLSSVLISYNEQGKMSELRLFGTDRKPAGVNYFTYEYDNKGNWTKAVVKDDLGNVVIEERTYSYFE